MADTIETTLNGINEHQLEIPSEIPLFGNTQFVLYPSMIAPLLVQDENVIQMINDVIQGSRMIGIFTRRPDGDEEKQGGKGDFFDSIYEVGTVAMVLKMLKIPDGTIRLLVHGLRRVRIAEPLEEKPYPRARVEVLNETVEDTDETKALKNIVRELLVKMVENSPLPNDLIVAANNMEEPGRLADLIASNLSISIAEQQQILEETDTQKRLRRVQEILGRELEIAKLGSKIQSQVKSSLDRHQREFLLREQLKAIRRELGEEQDAGEELDQLLEQIKEAKLPEYALKVANKELTRLRSMNPASAEYTVGRTYLDWIINLPWSKTTRDNLNLKKAQQILDEDHYNLAKVKERILEYLAVIKLRKEIRGPILCFVGPPGVGKTSLGRSIARSMGRKFARLSLGGIHDEAEIRGHRRTYIGSMPGSIIKALSNVGSNNPVFMLDEIDKVGSDFRGDPASALLEVLDPEQNNTFTDHYLDMPFDLSNVMFITTANTLDTIPGPLRDRMDTLQLSGYPLHDKMQIARQYLIPRALGNTGLKKEQVTFKDEAIEEIIECYTREAGLRNLERELTGICRKVARRVAEGEKAPVVVNRTHVWNALGPIRFDRDEIAGRTQIAGVAIGLAWTPAGGDVLFMEATSTPGQGRMVLTGQLGEVMKESAQAARTYLHSQARRFKISGTQFAKNDFHIHVPAGAVPKDGPSAGVTLMTALASLLRNEPIRDRLAMTGEVTLKGTVLPVGGIKEKVLAAHRSGIKTIILPRRNEKDLIDVPEEIRRDLEFHFVDSADEVIHLAFGDHAKPARGPKPLKKTAKKPAKNTARKTRNHFRQRGIS